MTCPYCKGRIRGANKHKSQGIWVHKKCPDKSKIFDSADKLIAKIKENS